MAKKPPKGTSESTRRRGLRKLRATAGNMRKISQAERDQLLTATEAAVSDYRRATNALRNSGQSIISFLRTLLSWVEFSNQPRKEFRGLQKLIHRLDGDFITTDTFAESGLDDAEKILEKLKKIFEK